MCYPLKSSSFRCKQALWFRMVLQLGSIGKLGRLHYGDSQIEMDRISQDFRDALQERFGGIGAGMFPALSNVPSASIQRYSNGGFTQYTMYGDSTTQRAGHNRYGPMAQVVKMEGGGTITLRASGSTNDSTAVSNNTARFTRWKVSFESIRR